MKEVNERIKNAIESKGARFVAAKLIELRVSPSTADKVVRGKYPSQLNGILLTVVEFALGEIEKELAA